MSASLTRLLICLGLTTGSIVLLCLGIPWLFFVGLFGCWISVPLSFRPRSGRWGIIGWLGSLGAGLFLLWLSSWGREPLPLAAALGVWFSIVTTEVQWWRGGRKGSHGA